MARHVGEGLARDRQELCDDLQWQVIRQLAANVELDGRIAAQLLRQRPQPFDQVARVEEEGAQPKDEAAQVANHPWKRVDRYINPFLGLRWLGDNQLRNVFEGKRNGVDALDD